MTQSQPDWHDRFQADLEAMRQQMNDYFENQARLNADLRTRQEVQQQEIQSLRENLLIQADNVSQLTQTVNTQLVPAIVRLAGVVENLAEEFRQHRSDGHGGASDEQG